jgi:hypothetical protein
VTANAAANVALISD